MLAEMGSESMALAETGASLKEAYATYSYDDEMDEHMRRYEEEEAEEARRRRRKARRRRDGRIDDIEEYESRRAKKKARKAARRARKNKRNLKRNLKRTAKNKNNKKNKKAVKNPFQAAVFPTTNGTNSTANGTIARRPKTKKQKLTPRQRQLKKKARDYEHEARYQRSKAKMHEANARLYKAEAREKKEHKKWEVRAGQSTFDVKKAREAVQAIQGELESEDLKQDKQFWDEYYGRKRVAGRGDRKSPKADAATDAVGSKKPKPDLALPLYKVAHIASFEEAYGLSKKIPKLDDSLKVDGDAYLRFVMENM